MPGHSNALLAGADWELGRALAERLAGQGADIVAVGPAKAAVDEAAAIAAAAGRRGFAIVADPSDEPSVAAAVARSRDLLDGSIDILVTLGGPALPLRPIWEIGVDEYDQAMAANLRGPFLFIKHVLPAMAERGRGRVVNLGATCGHHGAEDQSVYAASKWALRGLTRTVALEAGPFGVAVNLVSPGLVSGPAADRQFGERAAREGRDVGAVKGDAIRASALQRMGSALEVADIVSFLASDLARHVTGQELMVDGGSVV